ncbi:MAG: FCD domain-containing protein [Pararhodobacter sp.]
MAKTKGLSMSRQAYDLLRAEILSGRFRPEAKINIAETVARTKLSLGAVREALSRLSSEGLVTAETNKGFSVAPITLEELEDLTATRVMIECACLENAIANGDLHWESGIVSSIFELQRTPMLIGTPAHVNPRWTELHARFHQALVAGCDSPWLLRIREMLYVQAERYRIATMAFDRSKRNLEAEHQELADACIARDPARATQAMREHLTRTKRILIEADVVNARHA